MPIRPNGTDERDRRNLTLKQLIEITCCRMRRVGFGHPTNFPHHTAADPRRRFYGRGGGAVATSAQINNGRAAPFAPLGRTSCANNKTHLLAPSPIDEDVCVSPPKTIQQMPSPSSVTPTVPTACPRLSCRLGMQSCATTSTKSALVPPCATPDGRHSGHVSSTPYR